MKKLDIIHECSGTCPKCSYPLKVSCKREKAKDLRLTFGITLFLFLIFAIPRLIEFITWNVPITNPGWWISLAITIGLGTFLIILMVKIKNFELIPHNFAYCNHCKQKWLMEY